MTPNLELDLLRLAIALYPCSCHFNFPSATLTTSIFFKAQPIGRGKRVGLGRQTGSILAPTDLDEMLDVGDFFRHDGRWCMTEAIGNAPSSSSSSS